MACIILRIIDAFFIGHRKEDVISQEQYDQKGGTRMGRKKHTIWKYGRVQTPLKVGWPAWYLEDGFWKKTENVQKVVEDEADHVTFETKHYQYCFEYQMAENCAMMLAA